MRGETSSQQTASTASQVWAILGFGGNGITYSRIAADIVSAALAAKADPDADLYIFR